MVRADRSVWGAGPREDIQVLLVAEGAEVSEARAEALGLTRAVPPEHQRGPDPEGVTHLGAGWYQLPDGTRVQGRKKAAEAMARLRRADDEGAATDEGAEGV